MCTALSFYGKHHFFGRSLDLDRRYDESIVITPRNYLLRFNSGEIDRNHLSMIGIATIVDEYPLYYDATNEYGLSIAGLNFVGNALYYKFDKSKINIAPYELIPYLLSKYKSVDEAVESLYNTNIYDIPFNNNLKNAQLHWLISDKTKSVTLECTKNGIKIYENCLGILTNNPPFEFHLMNLNNYQNISAFDHKSLFSNNIKQNKYSKGLSGIGLPGDNSSMSRFVRCAFIKFNSVIPETIVGCVTQFFHVLGSVAQVEGSVISDEKCDRTQYMSCCDMDDCTYYYKTYNNSQISAVNMFNEDIDSNKLIQYKMEDKQQIKYIN